MQVRSWKKNIIGKVCAVSADLTQSFLRTVNPDSVRAVYFHRLTIGGRIERRGGGWRLINRAVSRNCDFACAIRFYVGWTWDRIGKLDLSDRALGKWRGSGNGSDMWFDDKYELIKSPTEFMVYTRIYMCDVAAFLYLSRIPCIFINKYTRVGLRGPCGSLVILRLGRDQRWASSSWNVTSGRRESTPNLDLISPRLQMRGKPR